MMQLAKTCLEYKLICFCLYFEFICFKCLFKYFLNIIYSFLRGLAVSCNLVQFTDVLSLIGHL